MRISSCLLLALAFHVQISLPAQSTGPSLIRCYAVEREDLERALNPSYDAERAAIEAFTSGFIQSGTGQMGSDSVFTIPVVVHVIYNTSTQNISDAQVQSQIAVLNEDFRRLNSDGSQTLSAFLPVASDPQIEFCLANRDPAGAPTTGITRTQTSVTSFSPSGSSMKSSPNGGKDPWPRTSYLNIWVCRLGGGVLGFATFPGSSASTDGVVVDYRYFGRIGTATSPFHLGRTGTHEVGHWLNLRHIWGDGGCGVDDLVADTPLSDAPNYGCPLSHVSCGTLDMVQNYMDYTDDACMNVFSEGQKLRMRALFAPGGFRESILASQGCGPVAPEYQVNQTAAIATINGVSGTGYIPATVTLCAGQPVVAAFDSWTAPAPFDIAITGEALVPRSGEGIETPGGQIVNVRLASSSLMFVSTQGAASNPMPWPGAFSLPFLAPPVALSASWQMVKIEPSLPDFAALSGPCQLNVTTAAPIPAGPTGLDASVSIDVTQFCAAPIPFYGTTYAVMNVASNGRILFGGVDNDFTPTVAEALTDFPFVGLWSDLNVPGGGSISIQVPAAGIVRVSYNNVPFYNSSNLANFRVDFHTASGVVEIGNLAGTVNPAAAFLGISRGNTGATDGGPASFSAGAGGIAGPTAMIYRFCGSGSCQVVPPGLNTLRFTPNAQGGYDWLGL